MEREKKINSYGADTFIAFIKKIPNMIIIISNLSIFTIVI